MKTANFPRLVYYRENVSVEVSWFPIGSSTFVRTVFSNWIIVVSRIAVLDIVKELMSLRRPRTGSSAKGFKNTSFGKEITTKTP